VANRAGDWLKQAERDLEQARASAQAGRFEWACFVSHQAAEKAVKALHLHHAQEAWGDVVARLINELPDEVAKPADLVERAMVLDTFYIPTRYPDSHAEGAPFEHYGALQGEEALEHAGAIVAFVAAEMAHRRPG
jgi:HEPN domain-containing protein